MISRVHVQAAYKPAPNPFDRDRVELKCVGWNGIKLHCQGKTYDLAKGKTFSSDIRDADIMVDVCNEARVLVQWPRNIFIDQRREQEQQHSEEDEDEDEDDDHHQPGLVSPISPSPPLATVSESTIIPPPSSPPKGQQLVVYEDEPSPSSSRHRRRNDSSEVVAVKKPEKNDHHLLLSDNSSGELSRHNDDEFDDEDAEFENDNDNDNDNENEENNPVVRSVGPSFTHKDSADKEDNKINLPQEHIERIQNHAANQLAFSRLSSTPLSVILKNFPPSLWARQREHEGEGERNDVSIDEFRHVIDNTDCVGKVAREGKDAAGKPLESEYYYVADFDRDEMRRDAVVFSLRKPGLRSCRKQHKVCLLFFNHIITLWVWCLRD